MEEVMPFESRSIMSLRKEFVKQVLRREESMRQACKRFNVSPTTGYKWLNRYEESGEEGLRDRSRIPLSSPRKTAAEKEELILGVREEHPRWGARKIKRRLEDLGERNVPSPSTITEILRRNGKIDAAQAAKHVPWKRFERDEPMDLLQMDFKGHFPIGAGRCHPLTVLDDHSRFALGLQACSNERTQPVQECLSDIFRRYGLPGAIMTDNGSPWAFPGSTALTRLAVWLIRLGINLKRSGANHPQTMGKDERLHRSLKAEVLQDRRFGSLEECQEAFDKWRYVYNHERPHQGIEMEVPAKRFKPSKLDFPEELPQIEYSPNDIIRTVKAEGIIHFGNRKYWLGRSLLGLPVAIRPTMDDGLFNVYFCRQYLLTVNQSQGTP
jgi:transposase InsO family protein